MKKTLRNSLLIILGAIFSTVTAFAQVPQQPEPLNPDDITKEDLQMVSNISDAAQDIQKEADDKVKGIVEGEGMEFPRFQEIVMSQQNPQMAGEVEISEDEQKTLEKVQPDLTQVNQEAQQKYMETIEEEGLSIQKFQQLAQAIQTNPEVAERFEKIRNDSNEG